MFDRPSPHYQTAFFAKSASVAYEDHECDNPAENVTYCQIRLNGVNAAAPPILIYLPYGERLKAAQ
jgi:hypothetical protein